MVSRRGFIWGMAGLGFAAGTAVGLSQVFGALDVAPASGPAAKLIRAAQAQIGVTVHYDGSYEKLGYPGGDVGPERGVCTDVIVRAYRAGLGLDLQQLVHEDMARDFKAYPANWGLSRPDPNIDHRRVPNLMTFLRRHGATVGDGQFEPGDLVTQMVGGRLPHIVLVSDQKGPQGTYLAVHNIGRGTELSDVVGAFPVTGHFRYLPV